MAASERWYFTLEELHNSPSRKNGMDAAKELSYRQQAAHFVQDLGQKLLVTQLCINTALVYLHRFFMFHSFTLFPRYSIGIASLFLAAKVEEQPRKLDQVIKAANLCLHFDPASDINSIICRQYIENLRLSESILLQTLGFELAIEHPHTYVVHCCDLIGASKELARAAYFIASNSLHLTTLCLQYKPTTVACFCIHLVCKWQNWEISNLIDGKDWFRHIDSHVTLSDLEELRVKYHPIFIKYLTKIKNGVDPKCKENTKSGISLIESRSTNFGSLQNEASSSDYITTKRSESSAVTPKSTENLYKKHKSSQNHRRSRSQSPIVSPSASTSLETTSYLESVTASSASQSYSRETERRKANLMKWKTRFLHLGELHTSSTVLLRLSSFIAYEFLGIPRNILPHD